MTPFFNCFNKLRIMFNNCILYIPIGRTKAYRPHASVQVIKEDTWHVYIWSGKYSTQRWEKVCWRESPIRCGTCISNTGADPGVCYRRGKCVKSLCSIRDKKNIFKHVSRTYGTLTEILVCRFLNIVKHCKTFAVHLYKVFNCWRKEWTNEDNSIKHKLSRQGYLFKNVFKSQLRDVLFYQQWVVKAVRVTHNRSGIWKWFNFQWMVQT